MNQSYEDIMGRIAELPKWWDESAVPRYCDFAPDQVANIYAREVVLAEIACQACGQRYPVAFSQAYPYDIRTGKRIATLAEEIRSGLLHYGDPPNTGCCASGPTMNSEPLRVIEFWRQKNMDWRRDKTLEIRLDTPELRPAAPSPETTGSQKK